MKRTNTAKWIESAGRWQINVQKDGVRKTFTSAKPGRTGQREANKKADDWLEKGLQTRGKTVESAYAEYLERASKISGQSNYRPKESRWRIWIQPEIGHRRLESLTQQQVQAVLDNAKAAGKSRKTLQNLYGDITSFSASPEIPGTQHSRQTRCTYQRGRRSPERKYCSRRIWQYS